MLQGRINLSRLFDKRVDMGFWGHYGWEHTDTAFVSRRNFYTASVGADLKVKILEDLIFAGEIWYGKNLSDLRGCIEFGVTLRRSVGPQSADAANPGRSALQLAGEMTRVCAIDHVVGRIAASRLIHLGNRDAKRLSSRQGPVGLDREGENDGQSGPLRGADDADGLRRVGQRVGV